MIIKKMVLHNFRQYHETQTIEFAHDNGKHITVVHGENGSGKTALLNAFNWALYGITDLPSADKLMNEFELTKIDHNGVAEMWIELEFFAKEVEYILKRTLKYEARDRYTFPKNTTGTLTLQYYQDNKYKNISNPNIELNRILPQNMRNYFFFDGERIDNLSRHEDNEEIKEAIKTIMDLEVFEKGITHTSSVRKEFMNEFKKQTNLETSTYINQLDNKETELEDLKTHERQLVENIKISRSQKKDIEEKLTQIESIAEIQKERLRLENEKFNEENELIKVQKELQDHLSKKSHLGLTGKLVERVSDMRSKKQGDIDEAKIRVPVRILRQIIDNNQCICGTSLSDENASEHIHHLLNDSDSKDYNAYYQNLKHDEETVNQEKENFFNQLKTLKSFELNIIERLSDIINRIEEKTAEISKRDFEDLDGLESKRKEFELRIEEFQKDLGLTENKIKLCESEITRLSKLISEQKDLESKEKIAKARYTTADRLVDAMKQIYDIKEQEVKNELRERLKKVYGHFLRKDFIIDLTSDFKITIRNKNQNKVAMSQGERQITSLAFIGAIVEMARDKYRKRETGGSLDGGGIYPLIMDSPFGALDSDHRRRVASGIQHLSDQIIVIVSTSQWKGEVEESLRNVVGNSYYLRHRSDVQSDGKSYDFTMIEQGGAESE